MDHTDKNKLFVLAILLVLLSSWVIGNFLYIMIKTTSEYEGAIFSPENIREGISGQNDSSQLFNILLTVFILILILLLVVTIFGILFESDLVLLTQISVVILAILITTTVFAFNMDQTENEGGKTGTISSDIDIPSGEDIFKKTSSHGNIIFPIILIGITLILITEFKTKDEEDINLDEIVDMEDENFDHQKKENISSEFKSIRNELREIKGVRKAIINAYKNMMNIFKKKGIKFEESMTSREFMNYAMKNFDVSDEIISEITNLFEEARYSSHELDELYRDQAVKDLEKLEEELRTEL
ncbi:MAG: DUF4129 domain-containing protein [Thermoplasmata archaeon]